MTPQRDPARSRLERLKAAEKNKEVQTNMTARKKLAPIHPGKILAEDLADLGITMNELGRALRTSAQYWLNLQSRYDLQITEDALPW